MIKTWFTLTLTSLLGLSIPLQAMAQEQAAILDLKPYGNIKDSEAKIISNRLRTLLVQEGTYTIQEYENIQRIIQQDTPDDHETSSSVDIGKGLAVNKVITGNVSQLGQLLSVTVRLINVDKKSIEDEFYVDCYCSVESLMLDKLPHLAQEIAQGKHGETLSPGKPPAETKSSLFSMANMSPENGLSIREQRPHLLYLDGSYAPNFIGAMAGSSQIGYLQQINAHFAWGIFGGITSRNTETITGGGGAQVRYYISPDPLSLFLDAGIQVAGHINPGVIPHFRPGIEYRDHNGFTMGSFLDFQIARTSPYGLGLYLGYAF